MKMKKIISYLAALMMIFNLAAVPSYAAGEEYPTVAFIGGSITEGAGLDNEWNALSNDERAAYNNDFSAYRAAISVWQE